MISVLQILLKILGIILLSILGIIIVLLLVVLFVPVRYRFKGYYKEEFVCHGKITWLLHLVSVSVDFEKKLITSIRILGIPLSAFNKKKSSKALDKSENKEKGNADQPTQNTGTALSVASTDEPKPDATALDRTNCSEETIDFDNTDIENDSSNKLSWFQKTKCKFTDIISKIRQILKKIRDIIINIRTKKETLQHYISILRRDEVKKAFSLCKKRIWILIRHILPKRMKVEADFGFNDPSTTGYILAVFGMLPASLGKKIILHPDFEHQLFVCDFYVKGAVNLWSMLHQLLCIISDKNCRALYHIVKKEILNERK